MNTTQHAFSENNSVTPRSLLAGVTQTTCFLVLAVASLTVLDANQLANAADARTLFESTCIACHGPRASGAIPGVPDLQADGRLAQSDAVLIDHILNGFQSAGSPMAMPAKGGNPQLTEADARALVEYMRRLTASGSQTSAINTQAPNANLTDQPSSPASEESTNGGFARGAKAWADNCHRCHNVIDPKRLSDNEWGVVLAHMRLRAGLDGQMADDIKLFLQASN